MRKLKKGLFLFSIASIFALGMAMAAAPVQAGNLWLTGHDADLHCHFGSQCNHYGIAVDLVRSGAPDPTKAILVLDGLSDATSDAVVSLGQAATMAQNTIEGAGSAIPYVHVDPTSVAFSTLSLSTADFSAIIIPSFNTCGGCDLFADDVAAINARTADIQTFFNDGGGLAYFSAASAIGSYYDSVPVSATGIAVSAPFTLTAAGVALGLTSLDANCCPTHNSFGALPADSPLVVAETDSAGHIETMFLIDGRIVPCEEKPEGCFEPEIPGVPEPGTFILFGFGLSGLALYRRKQQKS